MELENPVRIPDRMFFKIGEVAKIVGVKPYVLRYWETEFKFLIPNKSNKLQRMYTRMDIENTLLVKHLLYNQKLTIEGARQRLTEIRRQGELVEERTPKVSMPSGKLDLIQKARGELKELLEFCSVDH